MTDITCTAIDNGAECGLPAVALSATKCLSCGVVDPDDQYCLACLAIWADLILNHECYCAVCGAHEIVLLETARIDKLAPGPLYAQMLESL